MKLKFAKTTFLKLFRRPLLASFLGGFTDELAAKGLTLPGGDLDDEAFYSALQVLMRVPDGLPDSLFEALHAIQGMATPEGQARLESAIEQSAVPVTILPDSTEAEYALQVFVADPVLFARKLGEMSLTRIGKFEYYRSRVPVDRSQAFTAPDTETLARMVNDMDEWFPQHNRGAQLTVIEVIEINGEFWHVIRHGHTFARVPTAGENRSVAVIHFRPTVDDVAVYDPVRDELRIHAGTKGEVEMYRELFGRRLFGDPDYFSDKQAYRLEPLREDGVDSVAPIPGIARVVLRKTTWAWDNGHHERHTHEADDVFAAVAEIDPERPVIPVTARPIEAVLDFYFTGNPKPRRVAVRPPNVLKLGRHTDAALVHSFLRDREFRASASGANDAAA